MSVSIPLKLLARPLFVIVLTAAATITCRIDDLVHLWGARTQELHAFTSSARMYPDSLFLFRGSSIQYFHGSLFGSRGSLTVRVVDSTVLVVAWFSSSISIDSARAVRNALGRSLGVSERSGTSVSSVDMWQNDSAFIFLKIDREDSTRVALKLNVNPRVTSLASYIRPWFALEFANLGRSRGLSDSAIAHFADSMVARLGQ